MCTKHSITHTYSSFKLAQIAALYDMDVVKSLSSCYISCRLALWAGWVIHFIGNAKIYIITHREYAVNVMRRMWAVIT